MERIRDPDSAVGGLTWGVLSEVPFSIQGLLREVVVNRSDVDVAELFFLVDIECA